MPVENHRIILGLGTNIGDRLGYLSEASMLLTSGLEPVLVDAVFSPVYESPALLLPGSPQEWNRPFLNMAIAGTTAHTPEGILETVKYIERILGRMESGRWSPREIDIDLLAWDEQVYTSSQLIIPHPQLLTRDFALLPLADVAPLWKCPVAGEYHGKTASEIAFARRGHSNVRRTPLALTWTRAA